MGYKVLLEMQISSSTASDSGSKFTTFLKMAGHTKLYGGLEAWFESSVVNIRKESNNSKTLYI